MVLGVIASENYKCPIVIVSDSDRVIADSCQALLRQHMSSWPSATYPDGRAGAHSYSISMQESLEFNILARGYMWFIHGIGQT
jgi:hypothetical protein